ncbi:transposase [Mesorhizobium sp. DCY119]|uniref:transposase n=1 Tax=Mesorhizobium sp. DCY119 TaxID=2108445 RepID=UPI000E6C02A2|nr:transposase [Mesorhizobium sp. DCY119]RJG43681.1 IS110 family transposase [Mesorhizobium sp. DCY119]
MVEISMICAGCDVSKTKLDIALYPGTAFLSVAYDAAGLKQLDAFLKKHRVARVGFEASGGYEWRLLAHLRRGPVAAARFQLGQIRHFAKSRLQWAKNDRLDAALIAAFTASIEELPPLPDARFDELNAEMTYLEQLEARIAVLKTMAETTILARLKRLHEHDIARLETRRKARIALIARQAAQDATLAHRLDLLVSIKGIGLRTALSLAIRLPELGSIGRGQIAALIGVAPYDDDSGGRRGRRHIRAGRTRLRKSLFMSAFTASQHNPDLRAHYQRMRAAGKHHLLAIVAVTRKLAILANAVIARGTPWTPVHTR